MRNREQARLEKERLIAERNDERVNAEKQLEKERSQRRVILTISLT